MLGRAQWGGRELGGLDEHRRALCVVDGQGHHFRLHVSRDPCTVEGLAGGVGCLLLVPQDFRGSGLFHSNVLRGLGCICTFQEPISDVSRRSMHSSINYSDG